MFDLGHQADLVIDAARTLGLQLENRDALEDFCDSQTAGALDYLDLCKLSDTVEDRLRYYAHLEKIVSTFAQ